MNQIRITEREPSPVFVHDMLSPFGFLTGLRAHGLANYPSRAMVFPGGVVVTSVDSERDTWNIKENHGSLLELGMGAERVVVVPGGNLQQGLLDSPWLLSQIRQAVTQEGRPLSLYLARGMEPLLAALDMRWQETDAADWAIASLFDDKYRCRRLGLRLNQTMSFPAWQFLQGECGLDELAQARDEVLGAAERSGLPTNVVVLKRHDYDGGEGIIFWDKNTGDGELLAYCAQHSTSGFLMEAGYPRSLFRTYEASVQALIGDRDWRVDYPTLQLTHNHTHVGNVLAVGELVLNPRILKQIQHMITPFCTEAVSMCYGSGRQRNMGFDFLVVEHAGESHVLLLEINARNTAPCYAKAVLDQIAPRFDGQCAVAMMNRSVTAGQTHHSIECKLGDLMWDGAKRPGVILGNAGCISHGKVTTFVVGPNLRTVHEVSKELPAL